MRRRTFSLKTGRPKSASNPMRDKLWEKRKNTPESTKRKTKDVVSLSMHFFLRKKGVHVLIKSQRHEIEGVESLMSLFMYDERETCWNDCIHRSSGGFLSTRSQSKTSWVFEWKAMAYFDCILNWTSSSSWDRESPKTTSDSVTLVKMH